MTLEPADIKNIRSIRARAYAIIKKAGGSVAKFHRSRQVRGYGTWESGIEVWDDCGVVSMRAVSRSDSSREYHWTRAISALRAAGWIVDDNGTIREAPAKGGR